MEAKQAQHGRVESIEDVRLVVRLAGWQLPNNCEEQVGWIHRQDIRQRLLRLLEGAQIGARVTVEYDRVQRCSACGCVYEECEYEADEEYPAGVGCAGCGVIYQAKGA